MGPISATPPCAGGASPSSATAAASFPKAPFGSEAFLELLRREPFDLLCHHGAEVGDHKRPDYDVDAAVRANCHNLEPVLEAFLAAGGRALILTGSIFEADEGQGEAPLRAFNPYGLAKTLTWHRFRFAAERRGLAIGKLVVAAPFGPLEKDGFTCQPDARLGQGRGGGRSPPEVVRDHVAIAFLARAYVRLARLALAEPGTRRASPSGIALPLQDFAQLLSERMEPRLGRACRFIAADPPEAHRRAARPPQSRADARAARPRRHRGDVGRLCPLLAGGRPASLRRDYQL